MKASLILLAVGLSVSPAYAFGPGPGPHPGPSHPGPQGPGGGPGPHGGVPPLARAFGHFGSVQLVPTEPEPVREPLPLLPRPPAYEPAYAAAPPDYSAPRVETRHSGPLIIYLRPPARRQGPRIIYGTD